MKIHIEEKILLERKRRFKEGQYLHEIEANSTIGWHEKECLDAE